MEVPEDEKRKEVLGGSEYHNCIPRAVGVNFSARERPHDLREHVARAPGRHCLVGKQSGLRILYLLRLVRREWPGCRCISRAYSVPVRVALLLRRKKTRVIEDTTRVAWGFRTAR